MHKMFRYPAAICLTAALLLGQTGAAYAEENYGPGYSNGVPIEQEDQTEPSTPAGQESQPQEQIPEETPEERAAREAAEAEAAAAAEAARQAALPRLQTTVFAPAGAWSRPFVGGEWITLDGQGFRSTSTFITNTVGNVLYRTYTTAHGWSPWVMNGQQSTIYDEGTPIEAMQMRLSGYVGNMFNIYYTAVLEDGTTLDWASNGQTAGTMGTGHYITQFRMVVWEKDREWPESTEKPLLSATTDGIQYIDDAMRYVNGDGSHFTGWAWIGNDRYYFQNTFPVTGWQYIDGYKYYFDETGKLVQDLEPIIGANGPYLIKINKEMNCLTVYVQDGANGFIIPLKSFLCSTGDDTPLGTYRTPEKYRWRDMGHGIYTQYATRIVKGFLIHSILYSSPNNMTLDPITYNYLGIARSAGCIRLVSGEAKWIYDHCPLGTTVTIYNSPVPGPYERPAIEQIIPETQTWDPTDITVPQNQL